MLLFLVPMMLKGEGWFDDESVHVMQSTPDHHMLVGAPPAHSDGSRGNTELSQWVEHVTKQLIDDFPEMESDEFPAAAAGNNNHNFQGSGSGSGTRNTNTIGIMDDELLLMRPRKFARRPSPAFLQAADHHDDDDELQQQPGLNLLTLLLECAVAISVDNLGEAYRMLLELTQMASPYGESCAERVVAYFARAMCSRVINSWLGVCAPLINIRAAHAAFHVYNNVSPFVKFAHFTSNQAILEAFQGQSRVHIIDLDIMQGLQWPALFHILATRAEGPPHVLRLTGLGASMDLLSETGKQLSAFARRLGMYFEFHPVDSKCGEIADDASSSSSSSSSSILQIRCGETLAIHWLQHSLYDATGPDWKTLRVLQELRPRVMTLVEQEITAHGHGSSFLDRFVSSLHYYSTMFDSLGAVLSGDDPGRQQVEHCLMHREINNILAVGGPGRSGEDKLREWRSELSRNGRMVQIPMSTNSLAQAQLILNNMFPQLAANGYRLVHGDGTLRLGWKDTTLYTASAWTASAAAMPMNNPSYRS